MSSVNDQIHADVVIIAESISDSLERIADPHLFGVTAAACQCAIVEAFAAAEATALHIECKAWAKEQVDPIDLDFL